MQTITVKTYTIHSDNIDADKTYWSRGAKQLRQRRAKVARMTETELASTIAKALYIDDSHVIVTRRYNKTRQCLTYHVRIIAVDDCVTEDKVRSFVATMAHARANSRFYGIGA